MCVYTLVLGEANSQPFKAIFTHNDDSKVLLFRKLNERQFLTYIKNVINYIINNFIEKYMYVGQLLWKFNFKVHLSVFMNIYDNKYAANDLISNQQF